MKAPHVCRFEVGEYVYFVGLGGPQPDKELWGPFPVTKIQDMSGYYGWEDAALVTVKGLPLPSSDSQFITEAEYRALPWVRRSAKVIQVDVWRKSIGGGAETKGGQR